jgi:hypothetical protein
VAHGRTAARHDNSAERLASAAPLIEKSYTIAAAPLLQKRPLIYRVIGDE